MTARSATRRHGAGLRGLVADAGSRLFDRPRLLALLLGAVAACGFEPLRLWPLTLLAVALLIEAIAQAGTARRALVTGWLFGVGHFTVGNTWIATAFTYQANMPAWLGWIAVVLLSLYLAVWPALAAAGAWLAARKAGAVLVPAFAALWIVTEWMRAWVFTGFAWNPLGIALLGHFEGQGLAFLTPWIGTYGLSGVAVLLAGGLWRIGFLRIGKARTRRAWIAGGALASGIAALMLLPSHWLPQRQGTLPFTLVQPDIRQESLDDPAQFAAQFFKTARLSKPFSLGRTRLVLWPESGVPFYLATGYPRHYYLASDYEADPVVVRRRIGEEVGPGSLLLTGAVDLVMRQGQPFAARNVITAVGADGGIAGSYAKAHLVPYGEYLPLRWLLEPLGATRLVPGTLDFQPGPGPRTLDFGPWGKAGMQICYEIVFSGEVVDPAHRPDYIFNPSNDGWFGAWGPPQHLAQARLRAIEEGLPVLRATTTGISAVIDADGIVRRHVARHVAGRLDGLVPPAHEPTLFSRFGNALPLALAALLLALSLVASRRSRG
ncbi:MAG: apolipoprotein N-acyltransferase [Novosphingobium sp.]|nr:apolipoprotein N-acyltransferase [Novosphingobium sp.]